MAAINVSTTQTAISVTMTGGANNNFVESDTRFSFNGSGGNTYFIYVSATSTLELYVNDVKQEAWS